MEKWIAKGVMGNLSGRSRFHNVNEAFSKKLPGNFVEEANIARGLLNIFVEKLQNASKKRQQKNCEVSRIY